MFSPDGRLYQVEYAIQSTNNAGAVIGILAPGKAQGEAMKKVRPVLHLPNQLMYARRPTRRRTRRRSWRVRRRRAKRT